MTRESSSTCPHTNCQVPIRESVQTTRASKCPCSHFISACATCGDPIARQAWDVKADGTVIAQHCNGCWEVESRLDKYLGSEGGRTTVKKKLSAIRTEKH